jgi:hypothetical protein
VFILVCRRRLHGRRHPADGRRRVAAAVADQAFPAAVQRRGARQAVYGVDAVSVAEAAAHYMRHLAAPSHLTVDLRFRPEADGEEVGRNSLRLCDLGYTQSRRSSIQDKIEDQSF